MLVLVGHSESGMLTLARLARYAAGWPVLPSVTRQVSLSLYNTRRTYSTKSPRSDQSIILCRYKTKNLVGHGLEVR